MVTIIRFTEPGTDEYGDPIESQTTRTEVQERYLAPRTSSDTDSIGRDGVVVGLTIGLPAGTDILRTDVIEIDNQKYLIEGEPAKWHHPSAPEAQGIVVSLTRAEG